MFSEPLILSPRRMKSNSNSSLQPKGRTTFPVQPRLLISLLRDFLHSNCDFKGDILYRRNLLLAVCPKELEFLNRYVRIIYHLSGGAGVIYLSLKVEDEVLGNFNVAGVLKVGGRFKGSGFLHTLETFTKKLLMKVKYRELELVGEIELTEAFVRGSYLDRDTAGRLYFETLLPLKRVDYYKFKKLRRVLNLKVKGECLQQREKPSN